MSYPANGSKFANRALRRIGGWLQTLGASLARMPTSEQQSEARALDAVETLAAKEPGRVKPAGDSVDPLIAAIGQETWDRHLAAGAPEDWLRRVAAHAPGLLLRESIGHEPATADVPGLEGRVSMSEAGPVAARSATASSALPKSTATGDQRAQAVDPAASREAADKPRDAPHEAQHDATERGQEEVHGVGPRASVQASRPHRIDRPAAVARQPPHASTSANRNHTPPTIPAAAETVARSRLQAGNGHAGRDTGDSEQAMPAADQWTAPHHELAGHSRPTKHLGPSAYAQPKPESLAARTGPNEIESRSTPRLKRSSAKRSGLAALPSSRETPAGPHAPSQRPRVGAPIHAFRQHRAGADKLQPQAWSRAAVAHANEIRSRESTDTDHNRWPDLPFGSGIEVSVAWIDARRDLSQIRRLEAEQKGLVWSASPF